MKGGEKLKGKDAAGKGLQDEKGRRKGRCWNKVGPDTNNNEGEKRR